MNSLVKKLLAFTFVIALFTGCASVTDAGLDAQPEQSDTELSTQQPDNQDFGSEQDMSPIVPKPE
jgi:PBP1b-binding outer membrane lipoprotein LpoB